MDFYVITDAGDSLSRRTPDRLLDGASADSINWMVARAPLPIRRIILWQKDVATTNAQWVPADTLRPPAG